MLSNHKTIILLTAAVFIVPGCVDVPSTAPELTDTLKAAQASAKTDEVTDVKTIEENTEAGSNERIDGIIEQENKQEIAVEVKNERNSSE